MAFGNVTAIMKQGMMGKKSESENVPFGKKQGPWGKDKNSKGPAEGKTLSAMLTGKK